MRKVAIQRKIDVRGGRGGPSKTIPHPAIDYPLGRHCKPADQLPRKTIFYFQLCFVDGVMNMFLFG